MLQLTQDELPEKDNDQGLASISDMLKSQPVGCDLIIKEGGAMNGSCIMRVARHLLKINGGYCGGNNRHACYILMLCLEIQDDKNYVQIPRTIKIRII